MHGQQNIKVNVCLFVTIQNDLKSNACFVSTMVELQIIHNNLKTRCMKSETSLRLQMSTCLDTILIHFHPHHNLTPCFSKILSLQITRLNFYR